MVLAAIALSLGARREAPVPPAPTDGRILFVDRAGWYRRTPDEVAVLSPFDLTIDGLTESLPHALGAWTGFDRGHDPAVDEYLRDPDVSMERTYYRDDGEIVWLTAFGSRGAKSFHLFEHTPETCYPLGGWRIRTFGTARIPLGPSPMTVNHGVADGPEGGMVFLYFYVWDSPTRDAERGVLTFRVAAPVRRDAEATLAMLSREFLPEMFSTTVAWTRF